MKLDRKVFRAKSFTVKVFFTEAARLRDFVFGT